MKILDTEIFGFTLTLVVYVIYSKLFEKKKSVLYNPIVFSFMTIIGILVVAKIPIDYYNKGANLWGIFLGPATVALGLSLYSKWELLKKHFLPITIGVIVGSLSGIISVILLGKVLGLDTLLIKSLTPKSTTLAVGIGIAEEIKASVGIATAGIVITGNLGNALGEYILKIAKIEEPTAKGIALGTASHVFGTRKAFDMGEEEGAMGSLAIVYAGIITGILLPYIIYLFY